jgi:hypothetical protein
VTLILYYLENISNFTKMSLEAVVIYSKIAFQVLICFSVAVLLSSCGLFMEDREEIEPCPWDPDKVGHWITLPLKITPHQEVYRVGDTIRFSFHESVMLRDSNMQQRFDMSDFPFRPVQTIWRFEENTSNIFFPLLDLNNVVIEDRFRPEPVSDFKSAGYRMWAVIDQDSFLAYTDVILTAPGKYLSAWYDVYTATSEAAGGDRSYAEPIEFEGQCEGHGFLIFNTLVGDDHLSDFVPELLRLDTLFRGKILWDKARRGSGLDRGNFSTKHSGFFGFEVVE